MPPDKGRYYKRLIYLRRNRPVGRHGKGVGWWGYAAGRGRCALGRCGSGRGCGHGRGRVGRGPLVPRQGGLRQVLPLSLLLMLLQLQHLLIGRDAPSPQCRTRSAAL